ncbi:MAG: hypothetical protein U0X39_00050 [Bacteroidales bacterium]
MDGLGEVGTHQYAIEKGVLMITGKQQWLLERNLFQVGIKDPPEKDSESEREV